MTKKDLQHELLPILNYLSEHDVTHHVLLEKQLNAKFPMGSPAIGKIKELVEAGLQSGWLCPREANGIRFGRIYKSTEESHGFVVDSVDMDRPGPGHTHPDGEIDLCFAIEGQPTFDGNPPGWTVYPPNSWYIPTVQNGRMAILYFLPNGSIRFEPKPKD